MKITDYDRKHIEQLVRDGICPPESLRDHDILKAIEKGEKVKDIAMANEISRSRVWCIRKKYT